MVTKDSPSTLVIKLHDKFKVLREVRELRPSILEMQLEERSKCRRCQAEVRPSIPGMWLQCRLSDVTVGLRGTSSKLDTKQQCKTTDSPWKKKLWFRADQFALHEMFSQICSNNPFFFLQLIDFFSLWKVPKSVKNAHQSSRSSNVLFCPINSPQPKIYSVYMYCI